MSLSPELGLERGEEGKLARGYYAYLRPGRSVVARHDDLRLSRLLSEFVVHRSNSPKRSIKLDGFPFLFFHDSGGGGCELL